MLRRRPITSLILLILVFSAATAALVRGNLTFSTANPGGENFFIHWFSARSLFIDGVNPYSENARNAMAAEADLSAVKLEPGAHFRSPLYSLFLLLPFALIKDYAMARAVWMTLSEGILVSLVFMSLNLAGWRVNRLVLGLTVLLSLFWFHGLYPLVTGNLSIVVSLLVAGVFLAIRSRQYEFAGVLLGFASIQPHAVAVFTLFVVLWSLRTRHAKLAGWFLATIALMYGIGALVRPQWGLDYLRVIIHPGAATPSIHAVLKSILPAAGQRLGIILSSITGLILLIEWFISRKADFQSFYWTGLLTLTLSPWVGLPTEPAVFLIAFPAVIFSFSLWLDRWPRAGIILLIVFTLLLLGGIWLIYLNQAGEPAESIPGLFFAQPLVTLIMLYWVRWWAIQKPNVWSDRLA